MTTLSLRHHCGSALWGIVATNNAPTASRAKAPLISHVWIPPDRSQDHRSGHDLLREKSAVAVAGACRDRVGAYPEKLRRGTEASAEHNEEATRLRRESEVSARRATAEPRPARPRNPIANRAEAGKSSTHRSSSQAN